MVKIKLKSREELEQVCYTTDDNTLGTDGIALDYDMLVANNCLNGMLVGTEAYDVLGTTHYAIIIGNEEGGTTYVHLSWIAKIQNTKCIEPVKYVDNKYYISSKYILDLDDGTIIPKDTLPTCSCGAVGVQEIRGGYLCTDCIEAITKRNNYSYKPEYKYIGEQLKADADNNVWFGLEVEISTDRNKLASFMAEHQDTVYLKDDSSIQGRGYKVEVVSHPHSFNALMSPKGSW